MLRLPLALFLVLLAAGPAAAQVVPVTFRVDMTYQAETDRFDPATEFVDVAGTFNGWGATPAVLADPDGDLVYETTLGGFTVGQQIEFKFRIDGLWEGREEFPGAGNNRRYAVQAVGNVIEVWYNDEVSPDAPVEAAFEASPAEALVGGLVFFDDRSTGVVTDWQWTFEGGDPATSTASDPAVRYAAPGSYDVTLVVSGATGTDTLTVVDAVRVSAREAEATYWWNDAVFYELFVRSFYDSDGDGVGDFAGLIEKLDYLNDGDPETDDDLGVTGLWLMPIHDSPSYHGYDVVDYRSVHPDYGTMDDVRRFLDEAQRRGIRVIIDYVMNHSSNRHPWFQWSNQGDPAFRDFYRWSETPRSQVGPWGQEVWHTASSGDYYGVFWSGMPDLNYATPAVRDSVFAAARFWLEDVGVDGFRLDAVKYIFETDDALENTEATYRFWADFSAEVKDARADAFTVCEAWDATPIALRYVTDGGLDYCFEFELAGAMLQAVQTGDARPLRGEMERVYSAYPFLQYGTFLTNHDQNRVMDEVERDEGRAKAAAALYLTLPGIPYVYYGEELGQSGSKPDEQIRRPMQWTGDANAGFSTGRPWIAPASDYRTRNVAAQDGDPASLLSWYRTLIGLRTREAALRTGTYAGMVASAPSVMAFVRQTDDDALLVLVNTDDAAVAGVTVDLPAGVAAPGPYGLADLVAGDTTQVRVAADGTVEGLAVPAYGARVYRFVAAAEDTAAEPAEAPGGTAVLEPGYPNPASDSATIRFALPAPGPAHLAVYDVLGRRVATLVDASVPAGPQRVVFDVGGLPAGVYFYRLQHAGGQLARRLTVR